MGFDNLYCGPKLEYFYFRGSDAPEPLDYGGYFDLTTLDAATSLRRETILALQELGIDVEYSHHEVGYSQHEIDLRFDGALEMADKVQTYKTVVKEIATRHGVYATFMPKPILPLPILNHCLSPAQALARPASTNSPGSRLVSL